VQYIVPMTLLITLNARVVVSLRQITIHRANTFSSTSQSSRSAVTPSMFKSTRRVTLIVVVIVLLCIVCNMVAMVAHLLWSLEMAFSKSMSRSTFTSLVVCRRHFSKATNVLSTLNSAANFIIYCMCSRSFRAVLVNRCFCCCRRSRLLAAKRADQADAAVGDGCNHRTGVARGLRYLMARQVPQSHNSSRRHMNNERLLSSSHQPPIDDASRYDAVADSNDVQMQFVTTECNIPVTTQTYH